MGVPEYMKAETVQLGPFGYTINFLCEYVWLDRPAFKVCEHQPIVIPSKPQGHAFLHLGNLVPSQGIDGERGEGDLAFASL